MKTLLTCLVLMLLGIISGCATPIPPTKEAIVAITRSDYDAFTRTHKIIGPKRTFQTKGSAFVNNVDWLLRAWKQESNPATLQLYVEYRNEGWAYLNRAVAMTGDQLEISRIDSDVETSSSTTGVIVTETVGIIVPVDLLKCHTADGIIVRVYGQRDTFDIFVPGYYIDGFLSRIPAD